MEPVWAFLSGSNHWQYIFVGAFAWVLFGLGLTAIFLVRILPRDLRRNMGLLIVAFIAHGLWWIPLLASAAGPATRIDPVFAIASQVVACVGIISALRLHIAIVNMPKVRRNYLVTAVTLVLTTIASVTLGYIALGRVPDFSSQKALNLGGAMVLLVPLALCLVTAFKFRVGRFVQIATAATASMLASTSITYGIATLSRQAVLPLSEPTLPIVWLLSATACMVVTVIFMTVTQWVAQLKYIHFIRTTLEALPVGIAMYDERDRLVLWNSPFENLGEYKNGKLQVGQSYLEALKIGMKSQLYPPGAASENDWLLAHLEKRTAVDWVQQSHDGNSWYHLHNRPIEKHGLVTIASDITKQKRHEYELAAALEEARKANLAKSRFLANMSHEIRTPLNGIVAVTEAVSRSDLTSDQQEMIEVIRSSSETLQILLSDILDMARIESGQMKITNAPFDLTRLVNDTQKLYANAASEKGVNFICEFDPKADSWVMGDATRTRQILNNLLSNAVKFTGQGRITLGVSRTGDDICINVEDTGIGFDPEKSNLVFERFQQAEDDTTRRYGGSGLGLSICRELVEMMGGSITAFSQMHRGSCFTVILPLARITTPAPVTPSPASSDLVRTAQSLIAPETTKKLNILVADDNATNHRVIELILNQHNAELVQVENGQQAFEAFKARPFDLVLMDMQMPVMDGMEATRHIRAFEEQSGRPRTPVIMLTANAMPDHVTASIDAGADVHLPKPFKVSHLLELTQRLTSREYQRA